MPAGSLRCRSCATEYALEDIGTCSACFGPLDPVYDWEALARSVSRETIAAGPASVWRYAPLLPVEAPDEPRLAPGLTPLISARRLAAEVGVRELWLKLDTANPTHSFKDRVVAVAAQKARELGLETLACSSTGNLANAVAARAAAEGMEAAVFCPADLEPEKLVATAVFGATIYAVRGTYDDCSRLTVELSFELPWAFVNVGLAPTTRRARRPSHSRSPSSSAGTSPTRSWPRSPRALSTRRSPRDSTSSATSG